MRKDELLYLHQLLAVVQNDLENRPEAAGGIADCGVETPVSPMAAHAAKGDHERAVTTLAAALAAAVSDEQATADDRRQVASS